MRFRSSSEHHKNLYIIAHNASPVVGGGEIWIARMLAALQSRGHRVLLLCRNDAVAGRTAEFGIPTRVRVLGGDAMFQDAVSFAWMLRAVAPDALILTTFAKSWLGGLAARIARVPRTLLKVAALPNNPGGRTYRVALRYDRLLQALAMLPENVHCIIAGDGSDVDSLRQLSIQRLLSDGSLRRRMGAAGIQRIHESFSLERMLDEWEVLCRGSREARV